LIVDLMQWKIIADPPDKSAIRVIEDFSDRTPIV